MKRSLRERRVADVLNFSHVLWMKNSGLEITNKIEPLGAARRMIPWCLTRLQPNPIPHAHVKKGKHSDIKYFLERTIPQALAR